MADCFGWADFWTHALGNLGYEVWEPVSNAEPMQKAWARENGIEFDEKTWLTDIVIAQIKSFQPDIIFVNDYSTFKGEFYRRLRNECVTIRLVIGWCGAPYSDANVFKEYDLVLSNIPEFVEHFGKHGLRSEYMCHAFEPQILDKINKNSEKRCTVSFIGSIVKASGFHNKREKLLRKIVQNVDMEIFLDINNPSRKELLSMLFRSKIYDILQIAKVVPGCMLFFDYIPKIKNFAQMESSPFFSHYVDEKISAVSQKALFGLSMYQKLYESQITLNTHIDCSILYASNMRLYEATGVGTCLLTEWQPNLCEIFEPDEEVVTYRSAEEAIEKIHYLRLNKNECLKIAQSGQQRTLKSHTFDIRAEELDKIIRANIQ
jgi:spore maturation protein CgeB